MFRDIIDRLNSKIELYEITLFRKTEWVTKDVISANIRKILNVNDIIEKINMEHKGGLKIQYIIVENNKTGKVILMGKGEEFDLYRSMRNGNT